MRTYDVWIKRMLERCALCKEICQFKLLYIFVELLHLLFQNHHKISATSTRYLHLQFAKQFLASKIPLRCSFEVSLPEWLAGFSNDSVQSDTNRNQSHVIVRLRCPFMVFSINDTNLRKTYGKEEKKSAITTLFVNSTGFEMEHFIRCQKAAKCKIEAKLQ